MTIATNETLTLKDLAESIAMDHVADALVGRSVAANDADDFECLVLRRALGEWGFAASELDVDALREELRAALGREAAAFEDAEAEVVKTAIETSQDENRVIEIDDSAAVRLVLARECDDNCDGDGGCYWGENKHGSWCVCVAHNYDDAKYWNENEVTT